MIAAGKVDEGGEEVGDEHHAGTLGAGLGVAGPAEDGGLPDATFVGGVLGAAVGLAHFFEDWAVVVGEDEQGVVLESVFIDGADDLAEVVVEVFQHGVADG